VVDTHFIYSTGDQYAGTGAAGMANRSATLLALAENGLAQWLCTIAATVAVFLSESLGQNLIVITLFT
jgi:hypothetical protein